MLVVAHVAVLRLIPRGAYVGRVDEALVRHLREGWPDALIASVSVKSNETFMVS